MSQVAFKTNFSTNVLDQIAQQRKGNISSGDAPLQTKTGEESKSFMDHLKNGINEVNESHRVADQMATEVATGKNQNLHEAMLAMTQTELSFNFMVQVRNKALEAYQEIMRMPV